MRQIQHDLDSPMMDDQLEISNTGALTFYPTKEPISTIAVHLLSREVALESCPVLSEGISPESCTSNQHPIWLIVFIPRLSSSFSSSCSKVVKNRSLLEYIFTCVHVID